MDVQDIIKQYQEGASLASLSRTTGLTTYKVRQLLVNNHIQIRTQAQQNVFSNQQRSLSVDNNYFDNINNPHKAWILGFLAADGNVNEDRNRIKIGLSSIDKEILEKIKQEIQIERAILDTETNNGFQISELCWSSANHKNKLSQYDIVPNKTYKGIHLPNLSEELQLAYFLGYYDGDGCFKDDDTTCRIEICSYLPDILQDFVELHKKVFNFEREVYKDPSRNNYYTLTYSTQMVEPILNKCYTICDLYLERKFLKYITWAKRNKRI